MHIANISREVQDSSNFLYFATRSHPFSAFFPPRSTESGMFSVLRAQTPVESPHFPITTKTTPAPPHRLHCSKAEYFTALPPSRTTWQRPHLPHDSFKRPLPYPPSTLPRITRVTQTQPAKATRLPNTKHQRVSQQVPYCREVAGYPLLTTGLSAAVYSSRMHIANISREVQDSSNFLYFATRSHPFSAFSRREVQNPECFRYFASRPQLNHTTSPSPRRQRQHPHIVFTAVKQSISQHFPIPKTTSATSHQHLHIVFASISQQFPTSRTTWQRPHLPRDSRQSISRHFSVTKTTWQPPHRLRDTKQSVLPHFPTPKTTSATPHLPRGSKAEYFAALPPSRTTWQRPHLPRDSFKRPPSISSVRAAQNNQSNPNTASESDKTSQHKPPKSFTASTILP